MIFLAFIWLAGWPMLRLRTSLRMTLLICMRLAWWCPIRLGTFRVIILVWYGWLSSDSLAYHVAGQMSIQLTRLRLSLAPWGVGDSATAEHW